MEGLGQKKDSGAVERWIRAFCIITGFLFISLQVLWLFINRKAPPAILPPAGETIDREAPFKFAVVSDTRGNRKIFQQGLVRIKEMEPALILHAGDIAQRLNERQFNWILRGIDEIDLSIPFCFVPGDHDIDPTSSSIEERYRLYNRAFGPRRYWFGCGNALFVAFDNSIETVTEETLAWLEEVMNSYRGAYQLCFVFFHVPPDAPETGHDLGPEDTRKIMSVLSRHNVSAVFAGHLHTYEHYKTKDIPIYSTGGLGEENRVGQPHCFLLVSVGQDGTFSVEKHEVAWGHTGDSLEYLFRVKFPSLPVLVSGLILLTIGALLGTDKSLIHAA